MIRLLTQTYGNTNKRLWVTRDMKDNNELYRAPQGSNGLVIMCTYNVN
jgi:hypothetical protein